MSNRPGSTQNFFGARLQQVGTPQAPGDGVPRSFIRYDWPIGCVGKPNPGEYFPYFVVPVAFIIPASFSGSTARCLTAPANSATWTLNRISASGSTTQLGTLVFAAGAVTGTFNMSSQASIAVNDILYWAAPVTQDANMSDIAITVAGTRT
jgi:hypothetical protein